MPEVSLLSVDISQGADFKGASSYSSNTSPEEGQEFSRLVEQHIVSEKGGKPEPKEAKTGGNNELKVQEGSKTASEASSTLKDTEQVFGDTEQVSVDTENSGEQQDVSINSKTQRQTNSPLHTQNSGDNSKDALVESSPKKGDKSEPVSSEQLLDFLSAAEHVLSDNKKADKTAADTFLLAKDSKMPEGASAELVDLELVEQLAIDQQAISDYADDFRPIANQEVIGQEGKSIRETKIIEVLAEESAAKSKTGLETQVFLKQTDSLITNRNNSLTADAANKQLDGLTANAAIKTIDGSVIKVSLDEEQVSQPLDKVQLNMEGEHQQKSLVKEFSEARNEKDIVLQRPVNSESGKPVSELAEQKPVESGVQQKSPENPTIAQSHTEKEAIGDAIELVKAESSKETKEPVRVSDAKTNASENVANIPASQAANTEVSLDVPEEPSPEEASKALSGQLSSLASSVANEKSLQTEAKIKDAQPVNQTTASLVSNMTDSATASQNEQQRQEYSQAESDFIQTQVAKEQSDVLNEKQSLFSPLQARSTLSERQPVTSGISSSYSAISPTQQEALVQAATSSEMVENSQQQKPLTPMQTETIAIYRKDFANAVKDKVMVMINQKLRQVDIQLDPPELGNVSVRVNLQGEQAAVNFIVQNQQAKEALEQNMDKLKDLLSDSGVDVGDANVEHQQGQANNEDLAQPGQPGSSWSHSEDIEQEPLSMAANLVKASATGIDYYA